MTQPATNPLLLDPYFPPFNDFTPAQAQAAVVTVIGQNRAAIDAVVAAGLNRPAAEILRELEAIDDKLSRVWSPVGHLNAVQNSEELRKVYEASLAELTQYGSDMGQHQGLYQLYAYIQASPEFSQLSQAHQQAVKHALRDFTLAGIALPPAQQTQFKAIKKRLSELSNTFSNNVLDATQGWHLHITDEKQLAGLPDNAKAQARKAAERKALDGWVITLDFPAYLAAMTFAEDRSVREALYRAYTTRASEFGPAERDNSTHIVELLQLRAELAQLLGYKNYAELSLAKKMADSCARVTDFLEDLAQKSKPVAQQEWQHLQAFAQQTLKIDNLCAWDVSYAAEKLKQRDYELSQEELKPYFPAQKVLAGLFSVVAKLFNISVEKYSGIAVWHPDAEVFQIKRQGQTLAYFYLDLYARPDKRGGAWMDDCRVRRATSDGIQLPIAYLTCNFTPPLGDTPSLLSFDEVTTLFHEFGHGLHHMLTDIDVAAVSGINGVPWDAVEQPSQFLENWCWEPDAIGLISGHYQTGAPLPQQLLDKMLKAKHFHTGLFMLRQLEFALFDFRLHQRDKVENIAQVQACLDQVRQQVSVVLPPDFNRFQHSFSHIFSGGYAAGYYSYKWAEVLSADAFSKFEEEGIFNPATGQAFLDTILSQGGSRDALALFKAYRGREPEVDALLRHSGIRA
ncbi:M3 family metallopeptidase [Simiduia curdlanivorans]|uniref:oligopeptidase A n=1 Tax=Simiduia curdlanivorans TaxID=1492769 RepID=A0ABV8UZL4_9GAMM|nr:M3 family metallopeptidase [Simiduia curdlanivorans]MDN3638021.1 M3 family metallopeptidase [Simiduia curdlanivorans]